MSDIVMRSYNSVTIYQRCGDRYLDATAMCRAEGKLWGHYWENNTTKEYADELSSVIGIPISELVQVRKGGAPHDKGTYVHPRIAIHLSQWLSARFAVMVSGWIEELLTTGSMSLAPVGSAKWLLHQAQAMVAQEEELERQRQRVREVDQRVERLEEKQVLNDAKSGQAHKLAQAAVDIHSNNYGYYTVLGWGRVKGHSFDVKTAAKHGKKLAKICRAAGVSVGDVKDSRFGKVNTYPEDVLERYFDDI